METNVLELKSPEAVSQDLLMEILRNGAQNMLAAAIEAEAAEYVARYQDLRDEHGRRLVVRNGHKPKREIITGVGPVEVRQPRVNDRRVDENGERMRFTSKIIPPYLRRVKNVEDLIPWLYLKGISTSDFSEFLEKLTGVKTASLSPTTVVRLKEIWKAEYADWARRSLADKRYAYIWVDGVHFNIRLEGERQCVLVVIGALADGTKELVAIQDGIREDEQSWTELLLDLKARGLSDDPELAIGDGALGFWAAKEKILPNTRSQRCWVHKTANVLSKLPKSVQPRAKDQIHDVWMADSRQEAEKALALFEQKYGAKYPKAVECLTKDEEELLAFYDFPAEHWKHLRTTNPIESTFATLRLRTKRTKGSGSRVACLTMVFKLAQSAEKHWRKLNGHQLLGDVINGVVFKDGIRVEAA
ncbi:MAG: IS256 family transposase [Planctomycetota bacterium]